MVIGHCSLQRKSGLMTRAVSVLNSFWSGLLAYRYPFRVPEGRYLKTVRNPCLGVPWGRQLFLLDLVLSNILKQRMCPDCTDAVVSFSAALLLCVEPNGFRTGLKWPPPGSSLRAECWEEGQRDESLSASENLLFSQKRNMQIQKMMEHSLGSKHCGRRQRTRVSL